MNEVHEKSQWRKNSECTTGAPLSLKGVCQGARGFWEWTMINEWVPVFLP